MSLYLLVATALISQPQIDYPRAGQVVQGVVLVTGSTDLNGFQSAEILFGFSSEEDDASTDWFLIQTSYEPMQKDTLAIWDTSTIADGTYDLRLVIHLDEGESIETFVRELRVRNYLPIETSQPQAPEPSDAVMPEATATRLVQPGQPTALAPNELNLDQDSFFSNVTTGLIAGAGSVLVVLIYAAARGAIRKR